MATIVSLVQKVSNDSSDYIIWHMPLSRVGYLVAEALRQNAKKEYSDQIGRNNMIDWRKISEIRKNAIATKQ